MTAAPSSPALSSEITPMKTPDWFTQERFGMFIHWGLYAMPARHEWIQNREQISQEDYVKYFERFNPDLFNPSLWAKQAKAAGMKYVVITAKHHEGFCLWDSKFTEYKATNTPVGRDLLREFVDAFRAEGIRIGFYYSLLDWHHPHYKVDKMHPLRDSEEAWASNKDKDQSIYAQYMRDQVTELLTEFGQIDILWFDFSFPNDEGTGKGKDDWESEKLYATVKKHAPEIVLGNRLDLPEAGGIRTPEQYQPEGPILNSDGTPAIWEACQTFSGSWGYFRDEHTWKSSEMLVKMLVDGVSKNGNLLLNVGPNARGEFDQRAQSRLADMAEWMRLNSASIYDCQAAPEDIECPRDCRLTYNPEKHRLYLHIFSWPFKYIFLKAMADKIDHAQFLHDGSEVKINDIREVHYGNAQSFDTPLGLELPIVQPDVLVPVIEIFLKG